MIDLGAVFARPALSAGLGEGVQRGERRLLQQVAGAVRSQLAEQVAGVGSVTGALAVRLANDALHADLVLGLVRVHVALRSVSKFQD